MGLGGGVGTRTHVRVHEVERCSQKLLARNCLRDGKSEYLNQQKDNAVRYTVRLTTAEVKNVFREK